MVAVKVTYHSPLCISLNVLNFRANLGTLARVARKHQSGHNMKCRLGLYSIADTWMYKYLPVYILPVTKSYEWEQKSYTYSKYTSLYSGSIIMYAEKHILHRIMCIWDIHILTRTFPQLSQPHWKPRHSVSPKQETSLRGNGADLVVWLSGTCIKLHTSYTKYLLIVKEKSSISISKQEITLV